MADQLRVLSLGWGVQSFAIAAMAALGELPKLDVAIHADTGFERSSTYEFAKQWTPWLEEHGVPVLTVRDEKAAAWGFLANGQTNVFIPAFTKPRGQLRRQCTGRWKLMPLRRGVRAELAKRDIKVAPGCTQMWLGISLDEFMRARDSDVKYINNWFPLLDTRMTREDCETWLRSKGLAVPGKSSCTFCPYHNKAAWQSLEGADLWQAVQVDEAIRERRGELACFVHPARIPLREAINAPVDLDMTCDSGVCWV